MPRSTTTVSIFLASPSDVVPEREIVSRAIDNWNRIRGRNREVYFDLLKWETNVSAGFSSDGQQVVNEQIGSDYDVLIALFWGRIGSVTPRAKSGTTEEYELALQRYKNNDQIDIAFYFKQADIPYKDINPDQFKLVNELRDRVQSEGALYKIFGDDDGLKFEIELLLDRLARKFGNNEFIFNPDVRLQKRSIANTVTSSIYTELDGHDIENQDPDRGLYDISEDLDRHSQESSRFLDEMTQRLDLMSNETSEVTRSFEELGKLGPVSPADGRPLIARLSAGMDSFSDFLEAGLPSFAENSSALSEDARALIDISKDFSRSNEEISAFEDTLSTLAEAMQNSNESMIELLESTRGMQRMTSSFNRSKKRLINNIDYLISATDSSRCIIEEAIKEIKLLQ